MGEKRAGKAVWAIGVCAALTGLVGVTAAVASTGSSDSRSAIGATATATTVVVPQEPTTSTIVAPPPTAAPTTRPTLPSTTTTVTVHPRSVSPTTTITTLGSITGHVLHKSGAVVAGARVTLTGPRGEGTVVTDNAGRYEFNDLPAGQYDLSMSAESPAAPCQPQQPCIGSAIAMERRPVTLGVGEAHTEDWVYPYDSAPSYSGGASFTSPPATIGS